MWTLMGDPTYVPTMSDFETYETLQERLTSLYEEARADRRGLTAADLILARDAVERLNALLVAVRGHHFDTQHIHDKGVYPRIRLADRMLYEAAGLPPIELRDDAGRGSTSQGPEEGQDAD